MDKQTLLTSIIQQWTQLGLKSITDSGSDLYIDMMTWENEWQKESVHFLCCVKLDEQSQTVFYYEKTKDQKKGFFGDTDVDTSFQKGNTLYRKVVFNDPEVEPVAFKSVNLGDISKVVKESAKQAGWTFKTVLRREKASYSAKEQRTSNNPTIPSTAPIQTQASPSIKPKRKVGILFWVAWGLVLLVGLIGALGLSAPWMTYLGILLVALISLGVRRFLFKGFPKGLAVILVNFVVVFLMLMLMGGDQSLNRDVEAIELAFETQDIATIETYIHPEMQATLMPIFQEHQSELSRVADLMKTRKLIYKDERYAEYEVTENGITYTMIFQKMGEQWCLVQF